MQKSDKSPSGPAPNRLKIEPDWESAVSKALAKPRPAAGWPKPIVKTRKKATKKAGKK